MDWIRELDEKDIEGLLNKDMALVYQEGGIEPCIFLWNKLSGLNIYVSEKSLFDLKRLYIRRFHNSEDPHNDKKSLAVRLKVSEKFVQEALASTDERDDRQQAISFKL